MPPRRTRGFVEDPDRVVVAARVLRSDGVVAPGTGLSDEETVIELDEPRGDRELVG